MDREIKRQLFHGIIGFIFVISVYWGFLQEIGSIAIFNRLDFMPPLSRPLFVILVIGIILIIISKNFRVPILYWFLYEFERSQDLEKFPGKGAFFYVLGGFILALFFEPSNVLASMMILSIGDSSSHIVGKKLGEIYHPLSNNKKKIEGNLAGALISFIGALLFVKPLPAFVASFISMFVEGISFGKLWVFDDNLIVPLTAAVIIFLLT